MLTNSNFNDAWEVVNLIVEQYVTLPPEKQPVGFWFNRKRTIEKWVRQEVTHFFKVRGAGGYKSIITTILISIVINLVVKYVTNLIIKWWEDRKSGNHNPFKRSGIPPEFITDFKNACPEENPTIS